MRVLSYLEEKECRHGIGLLGAQNIRVSAEDAALYYGICAHVCDYDDLSKNFGGHPGAVILPVILALGEKKNSSCGHMWQVWKFLQFLVHQS